MTSAVEVLRVVGIVVATGVFTFALSVVMPVVAFLVAVVMAVVFVVTTSTGGQRASDATLSSVVLGVLAGEVIYIGLAVGALS